MTASLSREQIAGTPGAAPAAPLPYAPGWIDALNTRLQRLPVPAWLPLIGAWLVVFGLRALLLGQGSPYPAEVSPLLMSAVLTGMGFWTLILSQGLASSGREMMRRMRPMLRVADEEYARLEYETFTPPAIPSLVASLCGLPAAVLTTLLFLPLPKSLTAGSVIDGLGYLFQWTVFGGMVYKAFRTVLLVTRLQAKYADVDLFRPGPLYAFSGWTAEIVAAVQLFWVLWTIPDGPYALRTQPVAGFAVYGVWTAFAVLIFLLPVRGAHQRLQDEKDRLLAENGRLIRRMMEQMHASAEANDLERVKALDTALAGLAHEREVLSAISTWPWRLGSLRLVTSAVLLPLVVTVLEAIVKRWVP